MVAPMPPKTAAVLATSRSGHRWIMKMIESWGLQTFNFEDQLIGNFNQRMDGIIFVQKSRGNNSADRRISKWIDDALFVMNVRGFFNWAASTMMLDIKRRYNTECKNFPHSVGIWQSIAREAIGHTNIINYPKTMIRYEEFRDSEKVRYDLCCMLDGEYDDLYIDHVTTGGGGSSFDGVKYDGEGSNMKTSERCIQILDSIHRDVYVERVRAVKDVVEFYMENFEVSPEEKFVYNEIFTRRNYAVVAKNSRESETINIR